MSVEQARAYLDRYATDADFRARMNAATAEDQGQVLEEAGLGGVRPEHLEQLRSEKVDDLELDTVTGGGSAGDSNTAAMYMEAMDAYYTTNSQAIINKGSQMASQSGMAQEISDAQVKASNVEANRG